MSQVFTEMRDALWQLFQGNAVSEYELRILCGMRWVEHEVKVWGLDANNMGRSEKLTLTDAGRSILVEIDRLRAEKARREGQEQ